jgi:4'-phosphopantetheinyl transferase
MDTVWDQELPAGLASDEVHIWRASLDCAPSRIESYHSTLSADEQARAARFHFLKDRSAFIVARGVLRAILSQYLGVRPIQLEFDYSPYGKPSLIRGLSESLCFNVSHSHGLALYAFTHSRAIGVDVEFIRDDLADQQIADRFFSPNEVRQLQSLPAAARSEAFFNCWTRKEAYIKARGEGLSFPLHLFVVSLAPGQPAALLRTIDEPHEAARWSLRDLQPSPGFVGAVAVEGSDWKLKCLSWPGI